VVGMNKAFMHRTAKNNNYDTPYSMTEQLLKQEKFQGLIFEPCAGNGAIVNVLLQHGYDVFSHDLKNNKDYLKNFYTYDNVITNPPYGNITDDIIIHAKKHTRYKIAMLLRTNYLSGYKRYRKGIFNNLVRVYVFTRMADLRCKLRPDGKYTTAGIVYAWFVWNMQYPFPAFNWEPKIQWIDNQKYVLKKNEK
jgi:hypothetical protein